MIAEIKGLLWYLRGELCWLLGHKRTDTTDAWITAFGPRICAHCWEPQQ